MDLVTFNQQWTPIIRLIVTLVGFVFVIIQIRIGLRSLDTNLRWNKVNASYSLFDIKQNTQVRVDLQNRLDEEKIEVKLRENISPESADKIYENTKCMAKATEYLNEIETFCTAIQYGAVDSELAYHLYHARFIRQFEIFEALVKKIRKESSLGGDHILVEFEKTVIEWRDRVAKEKRGLGGTIKNSKI